MKIFKKNIPLLFLLFLGISAQIKVDEIKTFFKAAGATFFACHAMPHLVEDYCNNCTLKTLKELQTSLQQQKIESPDSFYLISLEQLGVEIAQKSIPFLIAACPPFCTYTYLMLDNGIRLIHTKPPAPIIKKISYRPPRFTNKSRNKKS